MRKLIYVIPGFQENVSDERYKDLLRLLMKYGFEIVPVSISWKNKTMSDYIEEFLGQIRPVQKDDLIYTLGFSFGAMISFISSEKVRPEAQFLCSLSPYFREDLPRIKTWWKIMIGKKRVADFQEYSCQEIAVRTRCKTFVLAGTEEGPHVSRRATEVHEWLKKSTLIFIENAKHDVGQKEYVEAVDKLLMDFAFKASTK